MEAGARLVKERLDAEPEANLERIENSPRWKHFGYSVLAPAVLYWKRHPSNRRYHDARMRDLAIRIGDLLASENEKGEFTPRLDSDWDTYTWLESYRLLEAELGRERRERWKRALLENTARLEAGAAERLDFPWYQAPYIGTSPNHYALWAQLLYLAGRQFDRPAWVRLGSRILHRFATREQTPDGYWGEHSPAGPTIGYDHLTLSAVAFYWEFSRDPAAMEALRRSAAFHIPFTYPDGVPVETLNNRNRYWEVPAWAQFAFTHFPQGRRYAEFLTQFFDPARLSMGDLGRLSQDALYYHEGPAAPIPQDRERYVHRLSVPASIRKTGPWVVSLSGIVETPAVNNNFFLDRQANLSVFHKKLGLIVSGANSKGQPELATLRERLGEQVFAMPLSSRLDVSEMRDRLSLAFNTFFTDLYVEPPSEKELTFRFVINGKGRPPDEAFVTLQLVMHSGETLETGAGRSFRLGMEPLELAPEAIGGSIRHHGWNLRVDPSARLKWPIFPFNPYASGPETAIEHAVGALSVPLRLKEVPGHHVRPREQEIAFTLSAE
ncbi:MAG TPA: hypothetical protein VHA11_05655 [Bryobacteraceae bacterium]|nr:hypothetical protein [Bryobacteraceae bacterium]